MLQDSACRALGGGGVVQDPGMPEEMPATASPPPATASPRGDSLAGTVTGLARPQLRETSQPNDTTVGAFNRPGPLCCHLKGHNCPCKEKLQVTRLSEKARVSCQPG